MSERMPSCIRAPPDALSTIRGFPCSSERRPSRASFSPTTEPMLPPMNSKSITARWTSRPSSRPAPVMMASPRPRFASAASSRAGYGLRSVNPRGSALLSSASCSASSPPSSRIRMYCSAGILKWKAQEGQTFRFCASRARYRIVAQCGHFSKTSAGTSRRSAFWSFRSGFLNQGMVRNATPSLPMLTGPGGSRSVPPLLRRDPLHHPERQEGGQQERAPVAQERQRDPRDGHQADRHPDVDDHVSEPDPENTEDDDTAKGVPQPLGDPRQPPEDQAEHQQHAHRADEAEFLADHAEDEVRVLLGQERQPLLRAEREALAEQPAAPDRDARLDEVPAGAARVHARIQEHHQPGLLVRLERVPERQGDGAGRQVRADHRHTLPQVRPVEAQEEEQQDDVDAEQQGVEGEEQPEDRA